MFIYLFIYQVVARSLHESVPMHHQLTAEHRGNFCMKATIHIQIRHTPTDVFKRLGTPRTSVSRQYAQKKILNFFYSS